MTFYALNICNLFLCITVSYQLDLEGEFPLNTSGINFQRALYDQESDNEYIYIAEQNQLYKLYSENLSIAFTVTENTGNTNINQILAVTYDLVVLCGTGFGGSCESRFKSTLTTFMWPVPGMVSNNPFRSAVGILSGNTFFVGATYPLSQPGSEFSTTFPPTVANSPEIGSNQYQAIQGVDVFTFNTVQTLNMTFPPLFDQELFLVYYVASFQHNGFTYFFTNQKHRINENNSYVSKVARICNSDKSSGLRTYVDIEIRCTDDDGDSNNLIKDAVVIKVNNDSALLVAAFSSGISPESPEGPSSMCVYSFQEIEAALVEEKKNFALCFNTTFTDSERYLQDNRGNKCADLSDVTMSTLACDERVEWSYVIGESALTQTAMHVFDVRASVTKIAGFRGGNSAEIYAGTENGDLFKLSLNLSQPISVSSEVYVAVDSGYSIRDIIVNDYVYILSSRKLFKYEDRRCEFSTTCSDCLNSSITDTSCGWCVYDKRCTKRDSSCPYNYKPNHWLSTIDGQSCPLLSINASSIPVGTQGTIQLLVTNLPESLSKDRYKCRFTTNSTLLEETAATRNNLTSAFQFSCNTPVLNYSAEVAVQLLVTLLSGEEINLGEAVISYYHNCSDYLSCSECLGRTNGDCDWCPTLLSGKSLCKQAGGYCRAPAISQDTMLCPRLETNNIFLPNTKSVDVKIKVSNLPDLVGAEEYSCSTPFQRHVPAIHVPNSQELKCTLQATISTDIATERFDFTVNYGLSDIALDDPFSNVVTVYNCEHVGPSCSHCGALNSSFSCTWCDGSCHHTEDIKFCTNRTCPPPTITSIEPNTGIIEGGTILTVQGTELGSSLNDIDGVNISGVPCTIQTSTPESITCQTNNVPSARSGYTEVVVNGLSFRYEERNFTYLDPVLSSIQPTMGPIAGGTRLSIFGQKLALGNRNVLVYVFNGTTDNRCNNAVVREGTRESNSSPWIECDMPPSKTNGEQIQKVYSIFEGTGNRFLDATFQYKPNPDIATAFPLVSIESGGIHLYLVGKNFGYIHNAALFLTDSRLNGTTAIGLCTITNDTVVACLTPQLPPGLNFDEVVNRGKRSTNCKTCFDAVVYLDGYPVKLVIPYEVDPLIMTFSGNRVRKIYPEVNTLLTIEGTNLNLAASEVDVSVTVGKEPCKLNNLSRTSLSCFVPNNQPEPGIQGNPYPEVNVSIGNVHENVGYLEYERRIQALTEKYTGIIVGVTISALVIIGAIVVLGILFLRRRRRKENKKSDIFSKRLQDLEMMMKEKETKGTDRPYEKLLSKDSSNSYLHCTSVPKIDEGIMTILKGEHLLIESESLQLGDIVGQGNFGRVFKGAMSYGVDKSRTVAIKTLHKNNPREIDIENFLKEALIMKDFHHENVMELIGICVDLDEMPVVVLPFLPHGNILTQLRDTTKMFTVRTLITYSIDIAAGMKYLSGLKFIHRDLAARNCMLTEEYRVKVADFGLSRDIYEKEYYSSDNKKTMLPVKWMAPECLDKGVYTTKSDVWSFGVVLWELFTRGVHPYPSVDNWDMINYLKTGRRMTQPNFCPDIIYNLMLSCWEWEPEKRPNFNEIYTEIQKTLEMLQVEIGEERKQCSIEHTYVNIS